ncbi:epoxide hydrolase [Penicillium brasilianum]|uniref:Epoxide hydrolase n=1 Tax=Penicillium brasilianum TaxID=104259 RepID=A0A1S9R8T4_PENBI|nr:epoxide hydrolase [Penicillium brasilianum]
MSQPFSILPATAKIIPKPFTVAIPKEKLTDMETLIRLSKLAPQTYENSQSDMRYGVTTDWLIDMKEQWLQSYNWKTTEDRINSFPQWTAEVEGLNIHFVGLFSQKPDAIPIILIHGWPGSFLEFLPILDMFRQEYTPASLPYHLIVPSLPGYTFSSGPPLYRNFTTADIARVLDQLMKDLGFESGYIAQGGDIGSRVARGLAVDHESCKAVHLNVCFMGRPQGISDDHLDASEREGIKRMEEFRMMGSGYALEHGTRPSTIGHVLATNPVALLAWIGEKWLEWVDEPLSSEHILESITLYWLTETFPRSIYTYRQNYPTPPIPASNDPRWYIHKPFGFSCFPRELAPLPRSWVETTGNLVFWGQHQKVLSYVSRGYTKKIARWLTGIPQGGHFAALERPDALKADLTKFVEQVWPGVS